MPISDVIQGWEYHGNIASSVARCLLPGRPLVFWNIRHTPYRLSDEKRLTALIIRFGKLISRHVSVIIYNAEISRLAHEGLGYEKSAGVVLYNGFDLSQFVPSREAGRSVRMELGVDLDIPLVALIARFHPMKDHTTFFHAAGLLLHKHPNVQFVLSGENVDIRNVYLHDLIIKNGLDHNVRLLGARLDISRLLTAIDILTLTSAWGEGFPNIVGEAMACGVPCVVTNVGDSAKIVGETGIVVPPKDPLAMSNALDKLLSMTSEQRCELGFAARRRVKENYTLTKMIKTYEDLYLEIGKNQLKV
jgi:glycosyltransferase involved in cell wall biosynthesis